MLKCVLLGKDATLSGDENTSRSPGSATKCAGTPGCDGTSDGEPGGARGAYQPR